MTHNRAPRPASVAQTVLTRPGQPCHRCGRPITPPGYQGDPQARYPAGAHPVYCGACWGELTEGNSHG